MGSRVTHRPQVAWHQIGPGVRVRRVLQEDGTALRLYRLEPGSRFDLHTHDFPEMGMLLSGSGTLVFEEEEQPAQAGDSFYLPVGLRHGFRVADGREPVVMLNVEARRDEATRPDPAAHAPPSVSRTGRRARSART